eukprot:4218987-Heterocapsa_arctica.AAC.1
MCTKGPRVSKRPRDIAQEEILAEEKVLARGAARDPREVMLITVTGPPWFDTATGRPLDTAKVEA